jgi:hypothetical protein
MNNLICSRCSHGPRIATIALLAIVPSSSAQVPKDLADVRLEYVITLDDQTTPIGSFEIAFEGVETERGPRLRITGETDYTVQLVTPFRYRESVEILCDEEGVEKFEAEATAGATGGDVTRSYVGIREPRTYHVTATTAGIDETNETRFPNDVRRANLGMFCGGFLVERLDTDEMLRDFPMLWPGEGTRYPRQKFRESIVPFQLSAERKIPVIISTVRKDNKVPIVDRYYHAKNGHQILMRLEEAAQYGLLTWELTTVNGVPVAESDLFH